ncbi:transcriptional regulator [Agarivorans sp. B2Z047]|nr:transcriptional regulator [Agarivorans sp. B2Z047]
MVNSHSCTDWHPADIKAALNKKGLTLRDLSREQGLAPNTLSNVFRLRYPKGQRIIAQALGVSPEIIWPSRY